MPRPQNRKEKLNAKGKSSETSAIQRPQTRAWVKKEAQQRKLPNEPSNTSPLLNATNASRTGHHTVSAAIPEEERGRIQPSANREVTRTKRSPEVLASSPDGGKELPIAAVETRSVRRLRRSEARESVVPLWLSGVSPALTNSSPPNLPSASPPISFQVRPKVNMDSSSSASKTSALTSEDVSTLKGGGVKKNKALSWEKLRTRRVSKIPTHDKKSEDIRSKLVSEPLHVKFKDVAGLRAILQDFIDEYDKSRPNKDSYPAIETLSNRINEWKPSHHLASVTNRDFDLDVTHCKSSNEAVIQRTIMISIIDRWQLDELFVFNCEGQWKVDGTHRLPTTGRMHGVTLPKPDLAIFFKLSALTGESVWAPYPSEISHCLRPDGGDERCFPFFFIEVKKAAGDLDPAFRANLHSASQALYNIFVWMSQAQQQAVFVDQVRVFTMDLNVQEINLRMHRAVIDKQGSLSFHFDDIISIKGYNKDQACLIVRNILLEYAGKELHSILQTTFEEVSKQEQMLGQVEASSRHQGKRKGDLNAVPPSKRSRSRVGSAVPAVPLPTISDTTSSFGASGLNLINDSE